MREEGSGEEQFRSLELTWFCGGFVFISCGIEHILDHLNKTSSIGSHALYLIRGWRLTLGCFLYFFLLLF